MTRPKPPASGTADEARARELLWSLGYGPPGVGDEDIAAVAQALAAVRRETVEACAKVCEDISERRDAANKYEGGPTDFLFMAEGALECAERIRALAPPALPVKGEL